MALLVALELPDRGAMAGSAAPAPQPPALPAVAVALEVLVNRVRVAVRTRQAVCRSLQASRGLRWTMPGAEMVITEQALSSVHLVPLRIQAMAGTPAEMLQIFPLVTAARAPAASW